MILIKKLHPVVYKILKHQTRLKIIKLRNTASPVANKLADALAETLTNSIPSDEREYIDRIE